MVFNILWHNNINPILICAYNDLNYFDPKANHSNFGSWPPKVFSYLFTLQNFHLIELPWVSSRLNGSLNPKLSCFLKYVTCMFWRQNSTKNRLSTYSSTDLIQRSHCQRIIFFPSLIITKRFIIVMWGYWILMFGHTIIKHDACKSI